MTEISYRRIAGQFYNRPLWLMPSAAEAINAFLLSRMRGGAGGNIVENDAGGSTQAFAPTQRADGSAEVHAPRASRFYGDYPVDPDGTGRPKSYRRTPDGTAIITIVGELVNRGAYVGASSGVVSYEGIKYQMLQAGADDRAKNVLIDIESPGGEAVGAFEAAQVIREVAKTKPVVAIVNGLAASAGYALVSGASRIVTIPTGILGSIGVVMLHLDFSAFLEAAGVKPTFIFAGAHKVDGNQYEALPDDVRERLQAEVHGFYDQFVDTVAAGRKRLLSARDIIATEAKTFIGQAAVDAGLADSVGTFEEVLADLAKGKITSSPPSFVSASTPQLVSTGASSMPKIPTTQLQPTTPEGWRAEYAASPMLQREFLSAEAYVAYRTALAAGKVRVLGNSAAGAPPKAASAPIALPSEEALAREFNAADATGAALRKEFVSFASFAAYKCASAKGLVSHVRSVVVTAERPA